MHQRNGDVFLPPLPRAIAHGWMSERSGDENGSAGAEDTPPELDAQAECDPARLWTEHASTQKSFDSPSLFRRDGRRHAR